MIKAEVEGCGSLASLGLVVDADGVGVGVGVDGVELSEFSSPVAVLFFFFAIIKYML